MIMQSMSNLQKKPKGRSKVWDEHEKIKGPTPVESKAKCKHCEIVLGANSIHGTSHLKRHLDRCAKKVHCDIKQYMLSANTSAEGSTVFDQL